MPPCWKGREDERQVRREGAERDSPHVGVRNLECYALNAASHTSYIKYKDISTGIVPLWSIAVWQYTVQVSRSGSGRYWRLHYPATKWKMQEWHQLIYGLSPIVFLLHLDYLKFIINLFCYKIIMRYVLKLFILFSIKTISCPLQELLIKAQDSQEKQHRKIMSECYRI